MNIYSANIDIEACCEAVHPNTNLFFSDEKQQANFELGVSMMVYKWDGLDIAVSNRWGGPDSEEKRDWITTVILDLFRNNKVVDIQSIEGTLLYAMMDEFETHIEDDSALPIAAGIIEIWKQCEQMNYVVPQTLYQEWCTRQTNTGPRQVMIMEDPLNPDDAEESSDDSDMMEDSDMMDYDESVSVNAQEYNEPVVDDDGFELVQPKGKRR